VIAWLQGRPLLPLERRRRVPWQWFDLVVVLFAGAVLSTAVATGGRAIFGPEQEPPAPPHQSEAHEAAASSSNAKMEEALRSAHPLVILLSKRHDLATLLICALVAVVVAPITEEFFFRLLFQGWLEAVERQLRRRYGFLRAVLPGLMPVLLVTLVFAWLHYRPPLEVRDPDVILHMLLRGALVTGSTVAAACLWISWRTGAGLADYGIVPAKLAQDMVLGAGMCLAVAPAVYGLQAALWFALPAGVPADPITMLLFGSVLGTLYYRTQRIVPSIAAHMALNGVSLALAWLMAGQG